jgi:hypothetical protein
VPGSQEEKELRIADVVREELAAAVRLSPVTAQRRIDTARLLHGPLTRTHEALSWGEITPSQVTVIVEACRRLPGFFQRDDAEVVAFAAATAAFQDRVLPAAKRGSLSTTRAAARRAVLAIDAVGEARRRTNARCTRDAWVSDQEDGISLFMAAMATEDAHAMLTQLNAHVYNGDLDASDTATIGERRVQALTQLVLGGDSAGISPRRAHLDLVMDLPTFLALRDQSAAGSVELRGAGQLSSDVVRDLLADPDVAVTIRRLVTDPLTGHLLDYGRRTYEVPQRLREFIIARDRTCRFPGCQRRADLSQIDHAIPWDDGGQTNPANLGALCVRHHQLKTFAGWQITDSKPDGSCEWISPQGRRYDHDPPPF